MELRRMYSVCLLVATFLTLSAVRTSLGQQTVEFVRQPDAYYYVARKEPANITCEVYGAQSIVFSCAGTQIPASSQRSYENYDEVRDQNFIRSTIQVTRSDIVNQDNEDFGCECRAMVDDSTVGATSTRGIISLSYLKKKFVQEPESQTVTVGSLVVLPCIPPEGKPFPEIVWRRDNKRVSDSDPNVVLTSDGSLTIKKARAEDSGVYQCIVRNSAGRRESSSAEITVKDSGDYEEEDNEIDEEDGVTAIPSPDTAKPRNVRDSQSSAPQFLEEPEPEIYITPKQPVSIICDVIGADIVTVLCNRQRLEKAVETKENRTIKAVRQVFNITYEEVDSYMNTYRETAFTCQCVAWYTDPQAAIPQWLSATSSTGNIYKAYLDKDFAEQPSDTTAQVGTETTLACGPPEGKPDPWVYWMFEQRRLDPRSDSRYVVGTDGSLTIRGLTYEDSGRYYCVAENAIGIRQSQLGHLTVSDKPVVKTTPAPAQSFVPTFPPVIPLFPTFILDLSPVYYLNSQGEAELKCSVVSADMLTFRCNNVRLPAEQQVIEVQTDPTSGKRLITATTTVTRDELEDSQSMQLSCQCFAWYIDSAAWKNINGSAGFVQDAHLDSSFLYEPDSQAIDVGDTAEFPCQPPEGQPKPTVTWLKNGVPVTAGADANIIIDASGTLLVESVRLEDAGEYICVATNPAGSRRSRPALLEAIEVPPPVTRPSTTPAVILTPEPEKVKSTTPAPTTPTLETSTAQTFPLMLPIFTRKPETRNYINKEPSITLTCEVVAAMLLVFECNGIQVVQEGNTFKTTDPLTGFVLLEKSIDIFRADVEAYKGTQPYSCRCQGYYRDPENQESWQKVESEDVFVEIASLKRNFEQEPKNQTVEIGATAELICRPPMGVPPPKIHWLKDGYRLKPNDNWHATPEGSLVIKSVKETDEGKYVCEAENIVRSRYTEPAVLSIREADEVHITPDLQVTQKTESEGTAEPETPSIKTTPESEVITDEEETTEEPLIIVEPDVTAEPEGTHEPVVTPEPIVTSEPEATSTPEVTPMSEITPEPEVTATPEVAPEPDMTPEPEATPESVATPEPGIAPMPEDTPEPEGEAVYPTIGVIESVPAFPTFETEPETQYYIVKNQPVTISCVARDAEKITFRCNSQSVPQSSVQYQNFATSVNATEARRSYLTASLDVSRVEVDNFKSTGDRKYWCQCVIPYDVPGSTERQTIESRKGYVDVAVMKRMFQVEPSDVSVRVGTFATLVCQPPEGVPEPNVHWLFNGKRIEKPIPTPDPSFTISSVQPEHAGSYVCVAENLAGSRSSKAAVLSIQMDDIATTTIASTTEPMDTESEEDEDDECSIQECTSLLSSSSATKKYNCEMFEEFAICLQSLTNRCGDKLNQDEVSRAMQTKEKMENNCSAKITGESCPRLLTCQSKYSDETVSFGQKNHPMVVLCSGIYKYLTCANGAIAECKIPLDTKEKTLDDVAVWFKAYCKRIIDDRMDCEHTCDVPISQLTDVTKLVKITRWCEFIHSTINCSIRSLKECQAEKYDEDITYLKNLAKDTCPMIDYPDNDDGSIPETPHEEPGNTGQAQDEESSAWSAHASLLLTSLVSVVLVLMTCR